MVVDAVDSGARVLTRSKMVKGGKFFEVYVMSELFAAGIPPEEGVSDVNEQGISGNPSIPLEPGPYDPGDGTVEPQMDPFWRRRRGRKGEGVDPGGSDECNRRGDGQNHKWGTGTLIREVKKGDGEIYEVVEYKCGRCGSSHVSTINPKRRR